MLFLIQNTGERTNERRKRRKKLEKRTWFDCTNDIFSCIFFPLPPLPVRFHYSLLLLRGFSLLYAHDRKQKEKNINKNQTKCWRNCKSRKENSNAGVACAVSYYEQFGWLVVAIFALSLTHEVSVFNPRRSFHANRDTHTQKKKEEESTDLITKSSTRYEAAHRIEREAAQAKRWAEKWKQ